jgi:hypothetical protein
MVAPVPPRWKRRLRRTLAVASIVIGLVVAGLSVLIAVKFGATAPPTYLTRERTVAAAGVNSLKPFDAHVTLQELVYFGSAW